MMLGDAPAIGSAPSRVAPTVATVIRSATAVAAATCSCIVLSLEFGAGSAVARESGMFGPVGPDPAPTALLFGSSGVSNGGGIGMRVAGGCAFAAITVGFAFLVARWAL